MKNRNMLIGRLAWLVFLLLFVFLLTVKSEDKLNWVMHKAGDKFSFLAPNDLDDQKVQGIDSLSGLFKSDKLYLLYDFGKHSDSLKNYVKKSEYTEKIITIDGKAARLISYKYEDSKEYTYFTGVHFDSLNENKERSLGLNKLTMTVLCKTKGDIQTAEDIFLTIKFDSISARVKKLLGEKNLDVMENPDKVTLQRIETSFKTNTVSEKILNSVVLNKEQFNKFKILLTDDNAYWWNMSLKCEPVPGLALVFEKGESKFTIRFCLECGILSVDPFGGLEEFNPIGSRLLDLFIESFPKDEVLLKLKKS